MAQANVQGCASSEHKGLEPAQRHHGLPFDPGPVLLLQLQRRQPQHRPNPVISAFQVLRISRVCLGGGSDLQGTKMNTKGRVLWVCCPALTLYVARACMAPDAVEYWELGPRRVVHSRFTLEPTTHHVQGNSFQGHPRFLEAHDMQCPFPSFSCTGGFASCSCELAGSSHWQSSRRS